MSRLVHEAHERRAGLWYGLTRSRARACPVALSGGRHREPDCMCRRHRRALDHACRWTDPPGRPVLTAEPYMVDGEDLAAFVAGCRDLGLYVTVTGRSMWYPEATLLLIVRRAGQ